jgi:hypothetical protein
MKHSNDYITRPGCEVKASAALLSWAPLAALALGALACSDSATVVDTNALEAAADGEGASVGSEGSVYAMTVHAFGPDSTTSYLVTMPSLDEGHLMDLDSAIELPDYANAAGIPGEPFVWLGYSATPTVERWDLRADGRFERGPTLSFANLGASYVSPDAQGAFISRELAAVPNQDTGELIFWNPTAMEIIGSLDLEIPERDGVTPLVRSTTARPDGTLLLSYYYLSADGEFSDVAGVVVVDPTGPAVVGRDEWEGCNYNYARDTADGTVYLTVNASWIQGRLVYPDGGPYVATPCLLRVLPGATAFDRSFEPSMLAGLAGGRSITGNLEPMNEREAFFVAWQDELSTEQFTVENFDTVRFRTPAYKWYLWDMSAGTAREVAGEPFAALPEVNTIDGRMWYSDQRLASDNGGLGVVPFYELTPNGPQPAFIGFGTTWYMLRVR